MHLRATLPRDGAPNALILRQVVSVNTQRAVNLRNTIFVREVMYRPESAIIARVIVKSSDSEVRCWMQAMTGTYPVASYLHKIGKTVSKLCPHCASGANEPCSTSLVFALDFMTREQLPTTKSEHVCPPLSNNISPASGNFMKKQQCFGQGCKCVQSPQPGFVRPVAVLARLTRKLVDSR